MGTRLQKLILTVTASAVVVSHGAHAQESTVGKTAAPAISSFQPQAYELTPQSSEETIPFPRKFGIGLSMGTLDGISGFYRINTTSFVQSMMGVSGKGNFYASGDWCVTQRSLAPQVPHFVPFYGLGLILANYHNGWDRLIPERYVNHKDKLFGGVRFPLGVQIYIPDSPLQVGAELGPAVLFAGDTYVYLQFAVNLRFTL